MDAVPMRTFELRLFGRFELKGPDEPIKLTSKKLAALLAFLACTAPEAHSRDKLMTLLWGSRCDAQARQNLRQALRGLRRALGEDTLLTAGESVSLRTGAIACDVARFEVLLRDGSPKALIGAIDLYKGGLLADMAIPEESWTEWVGAQCRRLESLALDAMVTLGEQEVDDGNHERALDAANRAIAVSNLREDAHRLVMRALAAGGRRADALRHYEELSMLLRRELSVEPDPITKALADELRKPHMARFGVEVKSGSQSELCIAPVTSAVHPSIPDRPSIAVLPFDNMSGDPEQEYFADGIADEILTALSKWRWFLVIARNSSFTFKGRSLSVRRIGKELGARYLLEGSVRKTGSRVRVSAQLIEAAKDKHIWADRYDCDLSDIFAVEEAIARHVVTAIDPAIQVSELDRISRQPPNSMHAWDHFLQGSYHHNAFTGRGAALALEHFAQAIEIDPRFAPAQAWRALTHVHLASLGEANDIRKTLASALDAAKTALTLDSLDASAHAAVAHAHVYQHQHCAARQAGRRAVELNPNYHQSHFALGLALLFGGAPAEAVREFEITARLSPRDPSIWTLLTLQALAHYTAKQYEAACDTSNRALVERPAHVARLFKVAALARLGYVTEAIEILADIPEIALFQLPFYCPFRNLEDWDHLRTALEGVELASVSHSGRITCGPLRCRGLNLRPLPDARPIG
jgi:TolB-like protein